MAWNGWNEPRELPQLVVEAGDLVARHGGRTRPGLEHLPTPGTALRCHVMRHIDQVGPDAWERVRSLRLRALSDAPGAFWATVDDEASMTPAQWRERLTQSDAATFVARCDDEDVGLVVGASHHAHDADAGLYAMWVAPQHRRAGVAVALVEAVVAWARTGGFKRLRLEVADANTAAVRLYERTGFTPTGRTGHLPQPRAHITEHERALDL